MAKHQLDLLENALDSLAESLARFTEGDGGHPKSYKFAVLHMAHFVELIFKHHIAQKHALLIYQNPFAKTLDRNKTIGLWEAINFIENEAKGSVSSELRTDLEWLKRLRNDIEHHKFEMEVAEVRVTIGRLFRSVLEFLSEHSDVDVESAIPDEAMRAYKVLSDEYEFRRDGAIRAAEEIANALERHDPSDPDDAPVRVHCDHCDNPTMVVNAESKTGFRCTFCDEEESDEVPANCDSCGATFAMGEMDYWETEDGVWEGRCYHCSGRYLMEKDD
ncbi:MAG: hypothetical protein QM766_07375 [Burkholderiaceae bacterium]